MPDPCIEHLIQLKCQETKERQGRWCKEEGRHDEEKKEKKERKKEIQEISAFLSMRSKRESFWLLNR